MKRIVQITLVAIIAAIALVVWLQPGLAARFGLGAPAGVIVSQHFERTT